MKRKLTTNSRLVNELFASYISTFTAFCELVNNSIQAKAKNIWIEIDYTKDDEVHPLVIKSISIQDDGIGVYVSDLDSKLLDIGTANKEGGKGIGRFAAFQIGKKIEIETVGYSTSAKQFSMAKIPLSFESFGRNINVSEVELQTEEKVLEGKNHRTYYKVSIDGLYDSQVTDQEPKKKIIDKFLKDKFADAIFERYPLKIYNKEIAIHINGRKIEPSDYVVGKPYKKTSSFVDTKGNSHKVLFNYVQIKDYDKRKVFVTTTNAGLNTISKSFEFDAAWLSPKIGGWFIYVNSPTLSADLYRNIDLDDLDEDWKAYRGLIKDELSSFFKERNKEFDDFTDKLKNDEYYPYKESFSSKSKVVLFDKLAYLVEDRYHLLNESNKLREIIYPLIDRTISNGELDEILSNVLKLNKKMTSKFSDLLEKTDLENIIEFSDKVASKIEDLEFLEKIVYSDIAKNVKERKELHKFLERMLWVFGEEFDSSTKLLSDKSLRNNLKELRDDTLKYRADKDHDNETKELEKGVKSITDLFMYHERILDVDSREVLIVELKAPKVKISSKEIAQAMKYATQIQNLDSVSSQVKFKVLLISSSINDGAQFDIDGRRSQIGKPYVYFRSEDGRIEVWIMKWSELIENVKRKLKYMSAILETKDVDVQEKVLKDFEGIDFNKASSRLKKVAS